MVPDAGLQSVHVDSSEGEREEVYEQPPPGPPLGDHLPHEPNTIPLTEEQKTECARSLRSSSLFKYCSDESILKVTEHMRREEFSEGQVRGWLIL